MPTTTAGPLSHHTIRSATAADVPAVLPMVAAQCTLHEAMDSDKYGYLPEVVACFERWLPQRAVDPTSVFLVAEARDADNKREVCGFLVGTVENDVPIYRVKSFGFIHDMWVEPAYRRMGIAQALVDAAVARYVAIGVEQVRLDTAITNEAARAMFARCGFRPSMIEMLLVNERR